MHVFYYFPFALSYFYLEIKTKYNICQFIYWYFLIFSALIFLAGAILFMPEIEQLAEFDPS